MKSILLLSFLFLAGCGQGAPKGTTLGQVRAFTPQALSADDASKIASICQAIAAKTGTLPIELQNDRDFLFSYSASPTCSDEGLGTPRPMTTHLTSNASSFALRSRNSTEIFPFGEVETTNSGVMPTICKDLNALESPKALDPSGLSAIWFTTVSGSKYCKTTSTSVCLMIEYGSSSGGADYTLHTTELISFETQGTNRGFFVERYSETKVGCGKGMTKKLAVLN